MDETDFKDCRAGYKVVYGRRNTWILLLEETTTFLFALNMTVTMAREGGLLHVEQADMHLALHISKMAKGGCLCVPIEEM
jgi:hypothetical protein